MLKALNDLQCLSIFDLKRELIEYYVLNAKHDPLSPRGQNPKAAHVPRTYHRMPNFLDLSREMISQLPV